MKLKIDKELVKKYGYILVGATILLLVYKILDNFGIIADSIAGFLTSALDVLKPILLGVVLAYFLFRPMRGIEKLIFRMIPKSQGHSRGVRLIAILIVYVITIILVILFFYATIPSVVESLTGLIYQTPQNLAVINDYLGKFIANGGPAKDIIASLKNIVDGLQSMTPRDIWNQVAAYFGTNPESIKDISSVALVFVKETIGFILSFFIAFFIGLYLMLDKERIIEQVDRFAKAVMNKHHYGASQWAVITMDDIFYKYFTGKILISMLVGFLFYLGLLVLGINYAPLFAMVIAVANMIPYFGPIIGAVPAILITCIDDPVKAVWVAIWVVVLFQVEGNVIAPNILGKIVELSPFWVLVSVVVGGSLFGIMGMFIAIPMFAVIKVFLEEGLTRWEMKKERMVLEKPQD